MASIYLYRINGGEVSAVSVDVSAFADIDTTFFMTVTNPPTPNGTDLSIPKHFDGTNVRNATAGEIIASATAVITDANLQNRATAIETLQTHPVLHKALSAIVDVVVQQLNTLRTSPTTVFPAITKAQAITAIVNAINSGAND